MGGYLVLSLVATIAIAYSNTIPLEHEYAKPPDIQPYIPSHLASSNITHYRQKRSLTNLQGTYSLTKIKNVYIPKNVHNFFKTIDFNTVYNELFSLSLEIRDLDPDLSNSNFAPINGLTSTYYLTRHLRNHNNNVLKCNEINGRQISLREWIPERLVVSTPISLADVLNVHQDTMSCVIQEKAYSGIQCIMNLVNLANTLGYTLTDKTPAIYYNELLQNYNNQALYLIVNNRQWTFDPTQLTSTICTAGPTGTKGQQDIFTVVTKRKYFTTIAKLLQTIVESMQSSVTLLQNIFLTYIESNIPTEASNKSIGDICAAIKRMTPIPMPTTLNSRRTTMSTFLDEILPNSLLINNAFTAITTKVNQLCLQEENKPAALKIYNGMLAFTLNVKTYLSSYVAKLNPNSLFTLPHQLPILLSSQTTEADIFQTLYSVTKARMDQDEMKTILIVLENEKCNTVHYLSNFLPPGTNMPKRVTAVHHLFKDERSIEPQEYEAHPEFRIPFPNQNPSPTVRPVITTTTTTTTTQSPLVVVMRGSSSQTSNVNTRSPTRSNSVYQADQPYQSTLEQNSVPENIAPVSTLSSPSSNDENNMPSQNIPAPSVSQIEQSNLIPQQTPEQQSPVSRAPIIVPVDSSSDKSDMQTESAPPFPFNPMPINSVQLNRKKRHMLTPLFSYLTGLASADDIEKLHQNENQILQAENSLSSSVEDIQKTTENIITAIRAQSEKMNTLYTDEKSVKTTLQTLLADSNSALEQIRSLTAAMEIVNDVSIEWSTVFSLIDLMPQLIQDLHDSVSALSSQSITPTILSAESINSKIPYHRRASMLAATISAIIKADKYLLRIEIPEFYPVFTVIAIKTLPISPQGQGSYSQLKLENEFVAMNNEKTTFVYNPAYCHDQKSVTICEPNLITLRHKVTTCSEVLVLRQESDVDLCLKNMVLAKPTTQSFIYINNMTHVRIFSPYTDGITHWCGAIIRPNATKIATGFTDLKFNSGCTLRTSELTLISPIPPSDNTDIVVEATIPDFSQLFELLHQNIELSNAVDLTQLSKDYNKLADLIANETTDINAVQEQLKTASSIKSLAEYKHFQVNLAEPQPVTTTVAALSYTTVLTTIVILIIILHICAPNITKPVFSAIRNCLKSCFCCIITGCKSLANSSANNEENQQQELRQINSRQQLFRNTSFRFSRRQRNDPTYDNVSLGMHQPVVPQPGSSSQDRDQEQRSRRSQHSPPDQSLIHRWELVPDRKIQRARLVIHCNGDIVYYDSIRKCVVDPDGTINTTYPNPTSMMITALNAAVASLPHPELEKVNDKIVLKHNHNIVYYESDNVLVDKTTRTIVDGFNLPPRESSAI